MRKLVMVLVVVLALSACGGGDEATPDQMQEEPQVGEQAQDPEPTMEEMPTEVPPPTESAPSYNTDACSLLEQADIKAAAFYDFPVGEPGGTFTDVPLGVGEADSCSWEFGNPNSQFHERLYLYVFEMGPGEDPEDLYEDNERRMFEPREPTESIGDRAMYSENTNSILVLEDGFLFYLRADTSFADEETEGKVIELARLVLERK
jgi:hypothetical protein